jgi:hypothetical protein
MNPNVEQVAENIHHNVPLMPFNLFTAINPPLTVNLFYPEKPVSPRAC